MLLGKDNKTCFDLANDLISIDEYEELSQYLNKPNEKYSGQISCTAFYCQYFFVGNSRGYVRVFDL